MTIGPSTTAAPYLLGTTTNVQFTSVLTSNDGTAAGALFDGKADGIGAYDNGDGTITVLINHELSSTEGTIRDHGSIGAYVERLVIDKATLAVISSDDLIQSVQLWSSSTHSYVTSTTAFDDLCSSDLAAPTAFYDANSGLGSNARLYLTGEENGVGRAFAVVVGPDSGTAYELPYLGNMAYENLVANPTAQSKTIVAMTDDSAGGQVYIYIGQKQSTGSEIEKAGLNGGQFFGIKVDGLANELDASAAVGAFTLQEIGPAGNVSSMSAGQIEQESDAESVTGFLRPEDCAWDPDHPNVLYFVTTNTFLGNSRLYKLTFTDIANPQLGGTIEAVLDGTEGQHTLDNLTVSNGKIILEEDPGNRAYIAKVWEYDIASDTLTQLAAFDPAKFKPGQPGFITQHEEASGVIDVTSLLGDSDTRAYLLDSQLVLTAADGTTTDQSQLLVMYVDDAAPSTPAPVLTGGGGDDMLYGTDADETLRGYAGNDVARAGGGNDLVYGGPGNDRLFGEAGDDSLYGQGENDFLFGDAGNDLLSGGLGIDQLTGGPGNDRLAGGGDGDLFIFDNRSSTGVDKITDFSTGDRLLTSVALADPDQDGVIPVGRSLSLSPDSSVSIAHVRSLTLVGTQIIDGTTYYSYANSVDVVSPAAPAHSDQLLF